MADCFDINALPEDCIANALSLTTPKDACRLSAVSPTFRSAACSDAVWERFLPSDYLQIISCSVDCPNLVRKFDSKKELYLHLCDHPILIDGGLKSFWLDKGSGKKCFMLAVRDLAIVWSETPQYWRWIKLPESRFEEVAELLNVCWLEIRGKINMKMLSPATEYAAYVVYTQKSTMYGFEDQLVEAAVKTSGDQWKATTLSFEQPGRTQRSRVSRYWRLPLPASPPNEAKNNPKKRNDGWMEVEIGEFFVKGGEDGNLELSVMEVHGGNWKSGLIVQGIEIRPKETC